jgi:DNA-binding SARP family transcriptional activator
MRIRVLGTVELVGERDAPLSARQRRLLAALVVRRGEVASVDWLATAVWGDALPADPVNAVQLLVSRLRRALGPEPALLTRAPGYVLAAGGTDADELTRLLAEAKAQDRPERAAERLDEALGLWRGPAYAEFADEDFVRAEAARLAELRRGAEEERVELALRLGRTEDAIARLEPMVREHPLRDRRRGQLVLALYRAGRQAEALARHEEYRRLLADELGIDPSPELQALHERVLRQDPGLAEPPDAARARPAGNLPAIDGGLVGRAADLAATVTALRGGRVVTLTGPGGVGKTRLALTACAQAAPQYPDGAWLVELAPVPPGEVADAVMSAWACRRGGSCRPPSAWRSTCGRFACSCCSTTASTSQVLSIGWSRRSLRPAPGSRCWRPAGSRCPSPPSGCGRCARYRCPRPSRPARRWPRCPRCGCCSSGPPPPRRTSSSMPATPPPSPRCAVA